MVYMTLGAIMQSARPSESKGGIGPRRSKSNSLKSRLGSSSAIDAATKKSQGELTQGKRKTALFGIQAKNRLTWPCRPLVMHLFYSEVTSQRPSVWKMVTRMVDKKLRSTSRALPNS
jgi:hypothetical protein